MAKNTNASTAFGNAYGSTATSNDSLVIMNNPGNNPGYWTGTMDEIAIFDADLSPNDVVNGAVVPGVPAVRFLEMYQMGRPY